MFLIYFIAKSKNSFLKTSLMWMFLSVLSTLFSVLFGTNTAKKVSVFGVFWSVFSRIRTENGEILPISPYSVRMRENADPKNSEYGHFLHSEMLCILFFSA